MLAHRLPNRDGTAWQRVSHIEGDVAHRALESIKICRLPVQEAELQHGASPMKLVLVVEDECGAAEVLQLLLEASGYRVALASNGRMALALLEKEKPAVVLSDFMMPHMTGGELGVVIRATAALCDIPMVVVSGTSEDVVQRSFADYDAFLVKPYAVEQLLPLLEQLCSGGRAKKEPPRMAIGQALQSSC
jgi:CheY-like chemotaxis protein